jgi:hypothetical protein
MSDSADKTGRPNRIVAFLRRGGSFHLRILILVGVGALALVAVVPGLRIGAHSALSGKPLPILWGIEARLALSGIPREKVDTLDWSRRGLVVFAGHERTVSDSSNTYCWDDIERAGWRVTARIDDAGDVDEILLEFQLGVGSIAPAERGRVACEALGIPHFVGSLDEFLARSAERRGARESVKADHWRWIARVPAVDAGGRGALNARRLGTDEFLHEVEESFDLNTPRHGVVNPERLER